MDERPEEPEEGFKVTYRDGRYELKIDGQDIGKYVREASVEMAASGIPRVTVVFTPDEIDLGGDDFEIEEAELPPIAEGGVPRRGGRDLLDRILAHKGRTSDG